MDHPREKKKIFIWSLKVNSDLIAHKEMIRGYEKEMVLA